ncbi:MULTISPECIES: TIGR03857 family LLM class F420-dependent oxidoreductase [unclassified Frankia]|uniref:TIGR03857 family LLM class F420-dependent oxidoreductase n=1 Tax=unclassified Frankia TaxID=2632575 RepID=UPI002023D4E7
MSGHTRERIAREKTRSGEITPEHGTAGGGLPEPIDELGIYLLPGRVKDPARAITEAIDAERLGLTSAWIAERLDMKELGVLCGAVAASTQRIRLGMGSIAAGSRHPLMTAAAGSTMQETFGDRLLLGLARGLGSVLGDHGMPVPKMAAFEDYASILLRLWDGETIDYDGPLGRFPNLRMVDPPTAPRPRLLLSAWSPLPKATALAARLFDGVFLGSELTVEAVAAVSRRLDEACERIGRDPRSLKLYAIVITAPDLSPEEELAVVNARMITHLDFGGVGELIMRENGWDPEPLRRLLRQEKLEGGGTADQKFHRSELLELGTQLPREWVETGCVVGSAAHCAARLREYLDAGVDHIVLHGSGPKQLEGLVRAWRGTSASGTP